MSISPKRQDKLSYVGTFFLPAGSLTTPATTGETSRSTKNDFTRRSRDN